MDKKELVRFKKILLEEKERIINASKKGMDELKIDPNDLPDENDQAASEINQNLAFQLRDRERLMISKIDEALEKIDEGTFGTCESCEEPIEPRRLQARPVSTMCVRCKEQKEHRKKVFA